MIAKEVLTAAQSGDDLDTCSAVTAVLNAECAITRAMGGDPAEWTNERVDRIGRMFREAFRDGRGRPTAAPRIPAYRNGSVEPSSPPLSPGEQIVAGALNLGTRADG